MLSALSALSAVNWLSIYSLLSLCVHILGIANAAHAVMKVRSSRGAIAWSLSLVTMPWIAIPLYWILGKDKFQGYAEAIHESYLEHRERANDAYAEIMKYKVNLSGEYATLGKLASAFESFPFTANNDTQLLIDGEQTFAEMLAAIASAKHYILLQSYIIHSDEIGNRFKDALIAKARSGVSVYLLYDGLGSRKLPKQYLNDLRQSGVTIGSFHSSEGGKSRFQINFRNHRKILVVDGQTAFMGGLNIGDEYLGKDPKLGSWRDTHVRFRGTAVKCLQGVLLRDWYWATREMPEVSWEIHSDPQCCQTAFILSTGPADRLEECMLFFLNLINHAQKRLWIASPYFVPDDSTLNALKLAALRGVDVRIILPNKADHLSVYFCAFSFYAELQQVGIQLYRYKSGFMHQKVILCDEAIAGVGTINLDNRSFYLNFEVMSFVINRADDRGAIAPESNFIKSVEQMLLNDLDASRLVDYSKYKQKPFWFKLAARVSRLMAPVL
ncbi:MAG: cardiolipin synthase [Phormidesmis sp.]